MHAEYHHPGKCTIILFRVFSPKLPPLTIPPSDGSDILSAATAASVAAYYSGSAADNTHHNHNTDQARGIHSGGSHEHTDAYAYLSTNGAINSSSGNTSLNQSLTNHHSLSHHPLSSQTLPNQSPSAQTPSSNITINNNSQSAAMSSPDTLPRLRYSIMTARPASLNDMRVPHASPGEAASGLSVPGLYSRSGTSFPGEDGPGGASSPSSSLLPQGHPTWHTEGQVRALIEVR